jgi:hypothetical protein
MESQIVTTLAIRKWEIVIQKGFDSADDATEFDIAGELNQRINKFLLLVYGNTIPCACQTTPLCGIRQRFGP